MTPLEKLFGLEMEFHRRLRAQAPGTVDATALHTCYALQSGYEPLIRAAGLITADDIELIRQRQALVADLRDLLAARDSLRRLLGMPPFGGWPAGGSNLAGASVGSDRRRSGRPDRRECGSRRPPHRPLRSDGRRHRPRRPKSVPDPSISATPLIPKWQVWLYRSFTSIP